MEQKGYCTLQKQPRENTDTNHIHTHACIPQSPFKTSPTLICTSLHSHTRTHTHLIPQCGFLLIRCSIDSASVAVCVGSVWFFTCLKVTFNGQVTSTPHSDSPAQQKTTLTQYSALRTQYMGSVSAACCILRYHSNSPQQVLTQ